MSVRAAILLLTGASVAVMAYAQSTLPSGITQSGGVIMMQPVADGSTDSGYAPSSERRPSIIRVLSATDHDIFSRALDAGDRGDWIGAKGLAAQGHDPVAARLVQWRYVLDRNSGASFGEIDAFLRANPDWPLRDGLFARAEAAIDPAMAPSSIVAWFGTRTPVSGSGMIRLGDALIATGHVSDGRALVQRGWISGNFKPDQELSIVQKDGGILTPDVDRARLSNLISRDDLAGARREMSRVSEDVAKLGLARMALRSSRTQGEALAARLPGSVANDPELLFDRARAARRANDYASAAQLLEGVALKDFTRAHPDKWWPEVNLTARGLIQSGDNRSAYALVSDTGLSSGTEFAESEFMAGWIALRFLKSPSRALPHFKKLEAGVSRPISLARARYWEARTYEAMGDPASAASAYRLAATAPDTFYGQVSLARIDPTPVLHLNDTIVDSSSVRADFEADDLTRAIRVLADLGQETLLRVFALREQELHPDAKRVTALAQTLVDLGFREIAVRVAKTAGYGGMTMLQYSYPLIPIPPYAGPFTAPDPAMVLGLIRQETEFDPDAVSRAGARGLMQLMPASARTDAARAGLLYRPNDLTADPSYNVQLGMMEFSTYVNNYGGSLILSMASYNAGAGNVRKWLATYGDPRVAGTDPIDWMEMIPFSETRNYVQRVLENTQIYRNRLAGRDQPLRILPDLYAPLAPPVKTVSAYPR